MRLSEPIPELAYLETLDAATLRRLAKEPAVRAVVPWLPELKIDPGIEPRLRASQERREKGGVSLLVAAFPDVQPAALAAALRAANLPPVQSAGNLITLRITDPADLRRLALLPEVRWIEPLGSITLNKATTQWILQSNTTNLRSIWDHGLRGEGQIVGHIDGLLDLSNCFFRDEPDNTVGPGHRKVVGYRDRTHVVGAIPYHGTATAGSVAGQDIHDMPGAANPNNGNAPAARLSHANVKDMLWNDPPGPVTFLQALGEAAADGAFIHTNSWDDKDTEDYTQLSRELDQFTWENEDHLVLVAPQNRVEDDHGTFVSYGQIHPPVNAKNSLAVNATSRIPGLAQDTFLYGLVEFTLDGRRKPDAMAPGNDIVTASHGTECGTRDLDGTSLATPAVAGAAALVRQYYSEGWYPSGTQQPHHGFTPSGALLKATLLNGTRDLTGNGYPDAGSGSGEGWGPVLLEDSLYFEGDARNLRVWDVRHAQGLATGEAKSYTLQVASNSQPLRITLVWNEPPGTEGAADPVVNNLDLVVTSPSGPGGVQTYFGNRFQELGGGGSGSPLIYLGRSVTGGARDARNNVEMVLLDTPTPGAWTITVEGTSVAVGRPGQGFALVATGDLPEPPVPTGDQNTLVVRTKFPDVDGEPNEPNLLTTLTQIDEQFDAVTYHQVRIIPEMHPDLITLAHPRDFYTDPGRSYLIELAQEVINAVGADAFTRGTADPADDIDRMVIVTNDADPGLTFGPGEPITADWATTGPWPYDLPGALPRPISVSIHSHDGPAVRFVHGMAHQLGLIDLGPHPPLTFAQPRVDEWDDMAAPLTGSDFLAWSKERAHWIQGHGGTVRYIARPAAGMSVAPDPIPLNLLSSTATGIQAIAIGLSENKATLAEEDLFYWIEARSNTVAGPDSALPESGVLVYYVNERVPQGAGPVRVMDEELATLTLADAALGLGQMLDLPAAGLKVTALDGAGVADWQVEISYDPPETDNDVHIRVGDPGYTSPDIWVDAPDNGFDPTLTDPGEPPLAGQPNRVYVRIWNDGPDVAHDITIRIRASEPYHTVGAQSDIDFNTPIGELFIADLPSTTDGSPPYVGFVEWTPLDDGDPHSCLLVEIEDVFNDINRYNNRAQQNVEEIESHPGSPYEPVVYRFGLSNAEPAPQLYYFRAEDVPAGWTADLAPAKALLAPGGRVDATLTIQPPEDARVCSEHRIQVTSWMPKGDTLVPVGGGIVQVDLRNATRLSLESGLEACERSSIALLASNRRCRRITAQGCTDPPRPNEEIYVRYDPPVGDPVYHTVRTDEHGCYSDFLVVTDGGPWEVSARVPAGECDGGAETPDETVVVDLPRRGLGLLRFVSSFHLGSTHPLGRLDDGNDANIYAALDAGLQFTDRIRLVGTLGLAQLTAESASGAPHPRWYHASLDARWIVATAPTGLRWYLQAGPGIYKPKAASAKAGWNAGFGALLPLATPFRLEIGADLHQVQSKGRERFATLHLGVHFR